MTEIVESIKIYNPTTCNLQETNFKKAQQIKSKGLKK